MWRSVSAARVNWALDSQPGKRQGKDLEDLEEDLGGGGLGKGVCSCRIGVG